MLNKFDLNMPSDFEEIQKNIITKNLALNLKY